ncbi:MAG: addiction module component CHP02574 family protein [Bacteroidales bacterium]|nr:addiction module component CHP02574 family protein [Bacteroidales bacterium]
MSLQYLHDISGNTTGVFIPIKAWNKLKEKYHDIEENAELYQWQKDIIDNRLEKIAKGNEKFQDFETAIDEIENEL